MIMVFVVTSTLKLVEELRKIKTDYNKIVEILDNYSFKAR